MLFGGLLELADGEPRLREISVLQQRLGRWMGDPPAQGHRRGRYSSWSSPANRWATSPPAAVPRGNRA